MSERMTVNDGLKARKLLVKKISDKTRRVHELAAHPSTEVPKYEDQPEQVRQLVQSVEDLIGQYKLLVHNIVQANLNTKIDWKGQTYSLQDILLYKQQLFDLLRRLYQGLLDKRKKTQDNVNHLIARTSGAQHSSNISMVVHFDIPEVDKKLEDLLDLEGKLDILLEKVNNQTELQFAPNLEMLDG